MLCTVSLLLYAYMNVVILVVTKISNEIVTYFIKSLSIESWKGEINLHSNLTIYKFGGNHPNLSFYLPTYPMLSIFLFNFLSIYQFKITFYFYLFLYFLC